MTMVISRQETKILMLPPLGACVLNRSSQV